MNAYKNEIAQLPLLNAEREKELAVKARKGDEGAREELVNANLRLVLFVARKFQGRGLDMDDLVADGNVGLLKAVDKFDPTMDIRFATYAVAWINQTIRRGIANTAHTIRIPVHISEAIGKMLHATEILTKQLGHTPTHAEIAEATGLTEERVDELMEASHGSLSLDHVAGEDDSLSYADLVLAREMDPEHNVLTGLEKDRVAGLLKGLKDLKEASVLRMRFGFDDNEPHTLDEIGKKLGLTRERVRQIQDNALTKLREKLAA